MKNSACGISLRICMAALACAAAARAVGADAAASREAEAGLEELDEVFVEGKRVRPKPYSYKELQKRIDWMARLVGEFDIGGTVVRIGAGGQEESTPVIGRADCVGFGIGPGVQCELRVGWRATWQGEFRDERGRESTFNPTVLLVGYEPVRGGVNYILVNSLGHADTAVGEMASADTVRARTDCAVDNFSASACEQLMRITARPDQKTVEVHIEQSIDLEPVVRYSFVMNRVPGSKAVVFGRSQGKAK